MAKLNVGIIGLGVGEKHIQGYQAHPDCRVIALCDVNAKKLKEVSKRCPGLEYTTEASDILRNKNIHAVSIASYDNFHHDQIIEAIKYDKHVFVEKPVCLHEREAKNILKCLKKKPYLKLSSNLILRKCPRFQWLRENIRKGAMGRLYHVEGDYNYGRIEKITHGWRGKIDFYSAVLGGGVHIVDLLMWLSGRAIQEVCAYGNNISTRGSAFKYNDLVSSIFQFDNGMTGKMTVNLASVTPHFHPLAVYGTKASFFNTTSAYGILMNSRDPQAAAQKIDAPYPGAAKGDLLANFIDVILGKAKQEVSLKDIFNTMSVCFAIEQSVNTGRAVRVKYL